MLSKEQLCDYYRGQLTAKFGYIEPVKVYWAVIDGIDKIVREEKPLSYVQACIKHNRYLSRKDRKRVKDIIRAVFPHDYFLKRARKSFIRQNPTASRLLADDKKQMNLFRKVVRDGCQKGTNKREFER